MNSTIAPWPPLIWSPASEIPSNSYTVNCSWWTARPISWIDKDWGLCIDKVRRLFKLVVWVFSMHLQEHSSDALDYRTRSFEGHSGNARVAREWGTGCYLTWTVYTCQISHRNTVIYLLNYLACAMLHTKLYMYEIFCIKLFSCQYKCLFWRKTSVMTTYRVVPRRRCRKRWSNGQRFAMKYWW